MRKRPRTLQFGCVHEDILIQGSCRSHKWWAEPSAVVGLGVYAKRDETFEIWSKKKARAMFEERKAKRNARAMRDKVEYDAEIKRRLRIISIKTRRRFKRSVSKNTKPFSGTLDEFQTILRNYTPRPPSRSSAPTRPQSVLSLSTRPSSELNYRCHSLTPTLPSGRPTPLPPPLGIDTVIL